MINTLTGTAACQAGGNYAPMAFDPGAYIEGYNQLAPLGVGFYPIHRDKSPAVRGKLNRIATLDPSKIRFWAEFCHHRSFAARLRRNCQLIVIDTENPWKHPDRSGPDGEMFLGSLLEDSDITLPPSPMVQTASGGFHRYMLIPKRLPIRSRVALWPGIDILTAGSSVILPGSRTDAGEYRAVRAFEECPIPEAPRAFVKLIRRAEAEDGLRKRAHISADRYMDDTDTSEVSQRQWWLLFRNRVFHSFWKRQGKAGDATDSAYEYHLAKACFCCGLNFRQAESVVLNWRLKHGLTRDLRQLRNGIMPKAWCEVAPWVEQWHAERTGRKQANNAAKTANVILAHLKETGIPQTPAAIAAALQIPRERVKKALQRMAGHRSLSRTPEGYQTVSLVGTF